MRKGRLETFSDGVLAIILTIMVLELKVPHGAGFAALQPLLPTVLSFVHIGIYWNNDHMLLAGTGPITGGMLWANLHLLFWLSLVPATTGWLGENHFTAAPLALYGGVLLMAGLAYWLLQSRLVAASGPHSVLARAIGRDLKGRSSPPLHCLGIAASFWHPWEAGAIYVGVVLMWLVPDRRIERILARLPAQPPVPTPVP